MSHLEQFAAGGAFSIKRAYMSFTPQHPRANWRNMVLSKGVLPRHQFITWLATQNRLATVNRLAKWGVQVVQSCVLCTTLEVETMENLCFGCRYSRFIWLTLLTWLGITRSIGSWVEEIVWLSKHVNNNRPRASVLGFIVAATIYHIWIERNARRFKAKARPSV
ncbi:uncharacterized protein LOC132630338 [Lycium barbarum]|uniref:uncharacterized protein LOC132630338 n=1 Tax=Lycium barbarum TaxID=112863 RepID=UPI00293F666B|nr:uncharacterized protein LOC132630338 [Lycium barbarum]